MKLIFKVLLFFFKNTSLLNLKGLRQFRWWIFRSYFNSPLLFVDENVTISMAHKSNQARFKCIGEVNIGSDSYIDYSGGLIMGKNIAISQGVKIFTHNHRVHDGQKNWKLNSIQFSQLIIEDYAWVGAGSIILPSVSLIAEGSIVAAGAVLTKNTEPYSIYAGNPAQKISQRRIDE